MAPLILPLRARRRRGLAVAVAIGLLLLMVSAWWLALPFIGTAQSPSPAVGIHKVQGASFRPEQGGLLFLAVIGTDVRRGNPGEGGGCDALHIVAINPQQKRGTILNFPRDSFLNGRKITDICRSGGVEAGLNTLKAHTGIDVQYYVTTEFSHFMAFIDELGGLDATIPYGMNDAPSGAFFNAGPQHLNGGQVLAFSRNRKDTPRGDFSRTENQGTIIIASLAKFRTEISADPHRLFDYMKAARRHVKSTIPVPELVKLALLARDIDPAQIQNLTMPGSTGSAGGASVVFIAPGDIYGRVKDDAIY
jgi:LCP family protein required for cell wall assembly